MSDHVIDFAYQHLQEICDDYCFGKPSAADVKDHAEAVAFKLGLIVSFDRDGNAVFHQRVEI